MIVDGSVQSVVRRTMNGLEPDTPPPTPEPSPPSNFQQLSGPLGTNPLPNPYEAPPMGPQGPIPSPYANPATDVYAQQLQHANPTFAGSGSPLQSFGSIAATPFHITDELSALGAKAGGAAFGSPAGLLVPGVGALPANRRRQVGEFAGAQAPLIAAYAIAPEIGVPTAVLDAYFAAQGVGTVKDTLDAYNSGEISGLEALGQLATTAPAFIPIVLHGTGKLSEVAKSEKGQQAIQGVKTGVLQGERGEMQLPGGKPQEPQVGAEVGGLPASAESPPPPESPAVIEQNPLDRAILETTQAMKSAQKLRPEQEVMFAQQRAQQMAAAEHAFQSGQGVQAAKAAAAGAFDRPTFDPLQLSPENEHAIRNEIDTTPKLRTGDRYAANAALDALMKGVLPEPKQLEHLSTVMGPDFTAALLDKIPSSLWANLVDAANLPRTVMASVDLSAPFRQGIVLGPGHPKEFVSSFGAMLKAALSDSNALKIDEAMQADPYYRTLLNAGLDHVKEYGTANVMKEESFMSKLAESIPVLGPAVRASERAYVTFLNKLRFDTGSTILKNWEEAAIPLSEDRLHNLALFLNNATGRGSLGGPLTEHSPFLNAMFFSPRLVASRAELVADLLRPSQDPMVRKQAMRDLTAFVSTGVGILSLMKLSGMADVQIDPRSPDFGKLRVGDTRVDFWGGFQPIARYIAQLVPVQGKFAGTKLLTGSNGSIVVPADWGHTFTRFLRSKLAPIPGMAVDIQQGQDFIGNPVEKGSFTSLDRQNPLLKSITPLAFQDLIDAIKSNGLGGVATGAAGALGLGVSTQSGTGATQSADKLIAQQNRSAAGYPTDETVYQSNVARFQSAPALNAAGVDPTQYGTVAELKKAYLDSQPQDPAAQAKASRNFDRIPAVSAVSRQLSLQRFQFYRAHPDQLVKDVDAGVTSIKSNKTLEAMYNRAKASATP